MEPTAQPAIPAGYKLTPDGAQMPIANIPDIELAEDSLVLELIAKGMAASKQLRDLKMGMLTDTQALVELAAEKYKVKLGGKQGNVTLYSYDQRYKVVRAVQKTISFDIRLQAARALIDACLQRWTEGARPELKTIINDAFQVDKQGNINTDRVLALRRLKIEDEDWLNAMQAISDAIRVTGSTSYIRLYERIDGTGGWRGIPLDLASV